MAKQRVKESPQGAQKNWGRFPMSLAGSEDVSVLRWKMAAILLLPHFPQNAQLQTRKPLTQCFLLDNLWLKKFNQKTSIKWQQHLCLKQTILTLARCWLLRSYLWAARTGNSRHPHEGSPLADVAGFIKSPNSMKLQMGKSSINGGCSIALIPRWYIYIHITVIRVWLRLVWNPSCATFMGVFEILNHRIFWRENVGKRGTEHLLNWQHPVVSTSKKTHDNNQQNRSWENINNQKLDYTKSYL
jgi:hypothetical protein